MYRNERGLSQEEVAHRAGLSLPTYRRLEAFPRRDEPTSASAAPTLRTVVRVMCAIGAEAEFLAALEAALSEAVARTRDPG